MAASPGIPILVKRSQDTALMAPPSIPVKRIKRPTKVLDEDDYTDALSQIIARDFFPGLLENETKQEYLNALDSRDPQWIFNAETKLKEVLTPGPDGRRMRGRRGTSMARTPASTGLGDETPSGWQGETPGSVISSATAETHSSQPPKAVVDTNMSLTAFQQRYTSEDNESFYKLLDKQNQKKTEKYTWMWENNKIASGRQIAHRKREQALSLKQKAEEAENEGKTLLLPEPQDTRQAMPDTWQSRPDNSLMFAPQSIEDHLQTVAEKNQETSRAPPKAVAYDNTRLPTYPSYTSTDYHNDIVPPSPSLSAVQDAIAGHPRHSSESSYAGAATPRVNGYAFVDDRDPEPPPPPSPLPSSMSTSSLSLLTTDNEGNSPNPFSLQSSSRRENLHHRMVEKTAKGKRVTTGRRSTDERRDPIATPKFLSSPMIRRTATTPGKASGSTFTPAGEKLMGRMGTPLRKTGMAAAGQASPTGVWEVRGKTPKTKGGARSRLREGWTPKA